VIAVVERSRAPGTRPLVFTYGTAREPRGKPGSAFWSRRSASRTIRRWAASGSPFGSRCTTAMRGRSDEPNSFCASRSASAAFVFAGRSAPTPDSGRVEIPGR
jgi:hypothetical protein